MRFALLVFITVPLLEMVVLIQVGGIIGALPTVALTVLTAVIGVALLRHEGTATIARVQDKLNRGEIPDVELLEGVMLLFGGALLLTPGFITDTIGFICLLPGLRTPIARTLIHRLKILSVVSPMSAQFRGGPQDRTFEGEFQEELDPNRRIDDKP